MSARPLSPFIHVRIHGRNALLPTTVVADAMTRAEQFPEYVPTRWHRLLNWLGF